ncbi:TPA: hypothetical protein DDW35_06730 [Candidatus Sumerlaeota bacterium]|jgi:hypothetical protein|nr:hypothetical protein [Candidatus Sumerlaeota bacterium]
MLPYKKTDLRQNKISRVKTEIVPNAPVPIEQDELDDILFAPLDKTLACDEDNEKEGFSRT